MPTRRRLLELILAGAVLATLAADPAAFSATYVYRMHIPGATSTQACPAGSFSESLPGTYDVTVPAGCTATIALDGAGGGGALGNGGNGARVQGTLAASSSPQTLSMTIQAAGSPAV